MRFIRRLSTTSDITIIGAGPAGLSLALALKNSPVTRHLQLKLIESMPLKKPLEDFHLAPPDHITNRVVSLTPQTIRHFQQMGSWQWMRHDRVQSYDEMVVTDGVSGLKLDFQHDDILTMLENVNIQSSLYQRLLQLDPNGTEIVDNTKVAKISKDPASGWPVLLLSDGRSVTTRLLVGCDGANSPARAFAGIEKRGWAYGRWGVVLTLQYLYDSLRLPTLWQRFLETGPILLLPLPGNQLTMVWSTTPELSVALLKLPEQVFLKLVTGLFRFDADEMLFLQELLIAEKWDELGDNLDWRAAQFEQKLDFDLVDVDLQWPAPVNSMIQGSRARFPLRLSHLDTYVGDRVALVGDAAHTVHPLAGQGLNLGQLDVLALVRALEKGCERGLDIGSPLVLEPYFSERYPLNHVMLGVCDKLHKLYSTRSWPVVLARSLGVNVLNSVPFVKEQLIRSVSGKQ